jgi:hypothetical protein
VPAIDDPGAHEPLLESPARLMDSYQFNVFGDGGRVVQERVASCVDDFQAEAMVRILLLSPGTEVVEAWLNGRLLCRTER